jgi:hypothetical protein
MKKPQPIQPISQNVDVKNWPGIIKGQTAHLEETYKNAPPLTPATPFGKPIKK